MLAVAVAGEGKWVISHLDLEQCSGIEQKAPPHLLQCQRLNLKAESIDLFANKSQVVAQAVNS